MGRRENGDEERNRETRDALRRSLSKTRLCGIHERALLQRWTKLRRCLLPHQTGAVSNTRE